MIDVNIATDDNGCVEASIQQAPQARLWAVSQKCLDDALMFLARGLVQGQTKAKEGNAVITDLGVHGRWIDDRYVIRIQGYSGFLMRFRDIGDVEPFFRKFVELAMEHVNSSSQQENKE